jgi:hypothetical protein
MPQRSPAEADAADILQWPDEPTGDIKPFPKRFDFLRVRGNGSYGKRICSTSSRFIGMH